METQPVEPQAAPVAPPETPAPVEAPESIASHAEQFNPPKLTIAKPEADDRPRHRAKSQQATAADVPRINELTKKLREAEARIAQYEQQRPRVEPVAPSVKPTAPPAPASATPAAVPGFTDPEPTLDQFSDQADPYAAWQRAVARWDRKKEAFEERHVNETKAQAEATERAEREADTARVQAHGARLAVFVKEKADFGAKLQAAMEIDNRVPPLLERAIMEDDNGPQILYHLLSHLDQLDEMRLLTDGKAVTPESVAFLRRRLRPYASLAAPTGSAASVPSQVLAPRPPNPVRTGPMHTGDDPPGEQGSIADHSRAFGPNRRR